MGMRDRRSRHAYMYIVPCARRVPRQVVLQASDRVAEMVCARANAAQRSFHIATSCSDLHFAFAAFFLPTDKMLLLYRYGTVLSPNGTGFRNNSAILQSHNFEHEHHRDLEETIIFIILCICLCVFWSLHCFLGRENTSSTGACFNFQTLSCKKEKKEDERERKDMSGRSTLIMVVRLLLLDIVFVDSARMTLQ